VARGDRQTAGPLRILILGRLDAHQKGLDLLLDFLDAHAALDPPWSIDLVGDGSYADEIARRRQASPVLARVLSVRPWSDPVQAMGEHDLLLLPSRYEGVPLVMLEAMALGLPVAASVLPGTRGYLPDECLFPVGDLGRAFDIVCRLSDPAERAALAERNRRIFVERASGAAFSEAVAALTETLASELTR
jgi:glycosyltransferase involved in cell wall biosynthesis